MPLIPTTIPLIFAMHECQQCHCCSGSSGHLQCGRCGLPGTSTCAGMERRKCHQTVISGSGAFVLVLSSSSVQVYLSFRKSNKTTFFLQTYNMKKLFGKNTENRRVEEERWVLVVLLSANIFVAPRDLEKYLPPCDLGKYLPPCDHGN